MSINIDKNVTRDVVKFDHFGVFSCIQNGNNWFYLKFFVQSSE